MTDRQPILVFDSGVGGLPYLALARRELPSEHFVYLADTEYVPYGERSPESVRDIVVRLIGKAIDRLDPKAVVVACNTASVVALAGLRDRHPIPFIGTVPAIKPAAERNPGGKFGVLATEGTVQADYLDDLIRRFAGDCAVSLVAAGDIVRFVENRALGATHDERLQAVRGIPAQLGRVDAVVLACTHFIHLEEEFRSVLGEGVEIIDSRAGVVRQLGRILREGSFLAKGRYGENHQLYVSSSVRRYQDYAGLFDLDYRGELGS